MKTKYKSCYGCYISHRMKNYKRHFVCFRCRKGFKPADARELLEKCPECGGPVSEVGLGVRVPRKTQARRWRDLEKIV